MLLKLVKMDKNMLDLFMQEMHFAQLLLLILSNYLQLGVLTLIRLN